MTKKPDVRATVKDVVNQVLDRPLVFVDWRSLPIEARRRWGGDARGALQNKALQALIGRSGLIGEGEETTGELVKDCIEHIARNDNNFEEVPNMRMTINDIELIKKTLEDMLYLEPIETKDNLTSSI